MAKRYTCYVLRFVTIDREHREYYGSTELLRSQSQSEACEQRLGWHLLKPLGCMARGVADTFQIEPLGHVLSESNVLLQEAILAARALECDSSARGACYSCHHLGSSLRNSARQVCRVCSKLEGQAARDALKQYVAKLDTAHALAKHAAGAPYKDAGSKKVVLPTQFLKSRSGVSGSENRKRQLNRGDYQSGDDTHRRLKRGRDPSSVVRAENARRPRPRKSGAKKTGALALKRPAAAIAFKRPAAAVSAM